jgi:formylglycine-generating enzyme required for sulfatase activity
LRKREEAERQQQAEAQERRRQEEDRKRQQEVQYREQLKQQQEAERQRQIELEEQRKQAGTSQVSSSQNNAGTKLQRFEFDVITVDKQGNENSRIRKTAEFFAEDLGNGVLLEMVKIPGGTYLMGSPAGQGNDDERPQHSVTLSSFCMGKYPITQAQWLAVAALPHVEIPLNREPSKFKGESRPVEQVSWHEAVEFCQRLSRLTKHQYRLPSEAEWEYACRAGTTTPFYFGETLDENLANYGQNIGETTTVDKYPPNAFGLYDMHGNVFEWCADCWHGNYADAPTDGSAWIIGGNAEYRVLRGGSWNYNPADCRSAYRSYVAPANRDSLFGFRVFCAVLPGLF